MILNPSRASSAVGEEELSTLDDLGAEEWDYESINWAGTRPGVVVDNRLYRTDAPRPLPPLPSLPSPDYAYTAPLSSDNINPHYVPRSGGSTGGSRTPVYDLPRDTTAALPQAAALYSTSTRQPTYASAGRLAPPPTTNVYGDDSFSSTSKL